MATGKRLHNIEVTHAPGRVGMSFTYDVGPKDHILMTIAVTDSLIKRLQEARAAATTTGDQVSVSDHVQLKIGN